MSNKRRNKFVRKAPGEAVKEPPDPSLHILRKDGSNLVVWLEALEDHLRAEYGQTSCFVESGALFVRPIPTLDGINATFQD